MRVVCVLGMHRSGTSCLVGSLEEAGLHVGDVITQAPHNAKGNRENKRIMDLNESVLAHAGGSWDAPPERVEWTRVHSADRDAIVEAYGGRDFGFKDPRTLFLLDFWREVLEDMTFVGTFRHPLLVAESLVRRNGGDPARWVDLWMRYNERLVALWEKEAFPIVRFDVDEQVYRTSLTGVAATLGLSPPSKLEFFEPMLRHHVEPKEGELPDATQRLYERLCSIAT